MSSSASAITDRQVPVINPWIIAIAVMLGTFMEVLDTTVVNVSLPHIAGNLSASVDEATWVSYLVSRRQRHHPSHDRLAGQSLRPQTRAHDLHHRLHRFFVSLRTRTQPSVC